MLNEATERFVHDHRNDDVRRLALQAGRPTDVDVPLALSQIAGWQTAQRKLPSWAAIDGIVYPPHLSMEQCSSEQTARYKADLVGRLIANATDHRTMADLTGGFGVDFSFLAPLFNKACYVERQQHLCAVARHNFPLLGLKQAEVVEADAEAWLQSSPAVTLLYMDPARRDDHGQKTFAIADCTPDVLLLRDLLLAKCDWLLLKLSPMLDWHKAVSDLGDAVCEVHIVAVGNECKELLLVLSARHRQPLTVCCVNDHQQFSFTPDCIQEQSYFQKTAIPSAFSFLFEPNAAIMKAGCFAALSARFSVVSLASNSHLFVAPTDVPDFPGRRFRIVAVSSLNKKELRQTLASINRANIAVRNFPLSAQQLRSRLKLADGGKTYIFGTTLADGQHVLVIGEK